MSVTCGATKGHTNAWDLDHILACVGGQGPRCHWVRAAAKGYSFVSMTLLLPGSVDAHDF